MTRHRKCITCQQFLPSTEFHRYKTSAYREQCNSCWQTREVRPMTKEEVAELRKVILRVYVTEGVRAVQAEFPNVSQCRVRAQASRLGLKRPSRKPAPKKAPHSDIDEVLKELEKLPPGYALRVYRTPSGRITMNPIGKVCGVWERDIGRHGRTKRIDIAKAREKLIAAKGAA